MKACKRVEIDNYTQTKQKAFNNYKSSQSYGCMPGDAPKRGPYKEYGEK